VTPFQTHVKLGEPLSSAASLHCARKNSQPMASVPKRGRPVAQSNAVPAPGPLAPAHGPSSDEPPPQTPGVASRSKMVTPPQTQAKSGATSPSAALRHCARKASHETASASKSERASLQS
jgi:hypothetical protein